MDNFVDKSMVITIPHHPQIIVEGDEVSRALRSLISPPHEQLIVEIPGLPVSTNHIWKRAGARFYKVPAAQKWDAIAQVKTRVALLNTYGTQSLKKYVGWPIELEIDLSRPTWRGKTKAKAHLYVRPDASNFIKSAEDAVMAASELDDCAVVKLIVRKCEGLERTIVRMKFLSSPTPILTKDE